MSYSHSIPRTVQVRRDHLFGLIGVVAALAACVTWVVTTFAFDTGTSGAASSLQATATRVGAAQQPATFTMTRKQIEGLSTMAPQTATFTMTRKQIEGLSTMAQQTGRQADSLMSMTPAQLASVGLGTGYQLPNAQELTDRGGHPRLDEPGDTAVHRVGHEPHVRAARRRGGGPPVADGEGGERTLSPLPVVALAMAYSTTGEWIVGDRSPGQAGSLGRSTRLWAGGEQLPVPLGDDFDVAVDHSYRGLVVDRVRRHR